ncbi:MAG: hypothetical protein A2Y25_02145 [Candidatus Melainabacteria bacterium GWF2_37_15]|nr:MAG: hypothetical protein A2Y25_02145 [Candidatus Melainabacteria bacterium GWF2_37_15]
MGKIKRWYDKSSKLSVMMGILSNMNENELNQVSKYLYQVVNIYWKQTKNTEEVISIGLEKLTGYYKAYQRRRWYDKNPSLSSAINKMSTLTEKDLEEIVDGFLFALKEAGVFKVYSNKKKELEEKENS